jgi:hypothetical protein
VDEGHVFEAVADGGAADHGEGEKMFVTARTGAGRSGPPTPRAIRCGISAVISALRGLQGHRCRHGFSGGRPVRYDDARLPHGNVIESCVNRFTGRRGLTTGTTDTL